MKHKSKRAKATEIPQEVRERVYIRDGGKCIICGKQGIPNSHYIRRSQGGLGIEQNVVTMCLICHQNYDNGNLRKEIEEYTRQYLKSIYGDLWNEGELIYNKWKDYEVK